MAQIAYNGIGLNSGRDAVHGKADLKAKKPFNGYLRLALTTFVLTWAGLDLVSIVCHDVIFAQILFGYLNYTG